MKHFALLLLLLLLCLGAIYAIAPAHAESPQAALWHYRAVRAETIATHWDATAALLGPPYRVLPRFALRTTYDYGYENNGIVPYASVSEVTGWPCTGYLYTAVVTPSPILHPYVTVSIGTPLLRDRKSVV